MKRWPPEKLEAALQDVARLGSVASAARAHSIPARTLRDAAQRRTPPAKSNLPDGLLIDEAAFRKLAKTPEDWWQSTLDRKSSYSNADPTALKVLVCPDVHAPNHNQAAWNLVLEAARQWKPDVWVFIGDVVDHESISHHPKSPDRRKFLKEEIAEVNLLLDEVQALNIPRVIFCAGNHEQWLGRYIRDKAPELFGLVSVPELLEIEGRGWEWHDYQEPVKIGKLHFVHDVGRCGKHTAVQSLTDYGHSIVMGHSHRAAVIYDGTADGERRVAMNVGTLINIDTVEYRSRAMAKREWQTGFGIVHVMPDGDAFCNYCPIVNGRTVVDGRVIELRGRNAVREQEAA